MTDKELIRRALMGDSESQKLCTEKGIVLPCPCCKGETYIETFSDRKGWQAIVGCSECPVLLLTITYDTEEIAQKKAIKQWNTRPAPPVGRCKDCKSYTALGHCKLHSQEPDQHDTGAYVEMLPDDFCSYFEPKEV